MLSRVSKIVHPSEVVLNTPLLVPSFSSKGFRFRKNKGKVFSEALDFINPTANALKEIALISAYDLKYQHMKPPSANYPYYPDLLIIDSGGFETLEGTDFSDVYQFPNKSKKWTKELYIQELNKWNRVRYPVIIVSYDNGGDKRRSLSKQIDDARKLFTKFPDCLHTFLIKGIRKNEFLNVEEILANIQELTGFSIIGLTEKELGESILVRMNNIARIRMALDNANIKAPIHIFGSLDPLTSVLYFISGAEIFDGLTWLRYSYYNGLAIYGHNRYAVDSRISEKDDLLRALYFIDNLVYLRRLQLEMKSYVNHAEDTSMFTLNSDVIKIAKEHLTVSLNL